MDLEERLKVITSRLMKEDKMKKIDIKSLIMLEVAFLIYSGSSVVAKFASNYEVASFGFILFYGLEVVILGIYALIWQQVIKKFELSIAYANKAVCLLWALVWSVALFKDKLQINQVIGIFVVMAGIFILNYKPGNKELEEG